jgi:signal transduction histidine kinase
MARILHIEDDPANRLLVRKLLQMAGHVVTDAADGLEGVHLARAEPPDLVLVDLNLPGLDGYEVTLRLRGEPSMAGVPIVAITAEGDRDTSLAVGCDGFLQKPIDGREFAETVEGYLRGRREITSPDLTGSRLRTQSYRIVAHLEEKVAALSAANDQLVELDRGRKEFYRNISHELATPMTPIVGYIKLLVDEELGTMNTAQVKALRAMEDCARRLRGLVDNLLDVSALETGNMRFMHRDYDFLDTARRAIARVADQLAERRISLLEELPRGPLPGWGDSERLSRAIGQLLDNAAKFTPAGGFVGVRVRRQPGGIYELCVADTGPGISADRAGRLFQPFYQVDGSPTRQHGGVGVGLAIARRIARGLGGDVRFVCPANESIEGATLNGTAFFLTVLDRAPEVAASGRS